MIDLDVVTSAEWDGKGMDFIRRVEKGEFELHTPYALIDLVSEWKYKELVDKIKEFYELYSDEIITVQKLLARIEELGFDNEALNKELVDKGVKDEDAILAVITSIFEIDYLVTWNRKHLKNKEEVINDVLQRYGLNAIRIVLPNET